MSQATEKKTGRNDPCPCGSGRKFKKCCGYFGASPIVETWHATQQFYAAKIGNCPRGRPSLIRPRVICTKCGAIFQSQGIAIGGDVSGSFGNNIEDCPFCGGLAMMPPGFVDTAGETLTFLQAADLSLEARQRFAALLKDVYKQKLATNALEEEAVKIDERLAPVARKIAGADNPILGALLLIILTALSQCNFDVKLDIAEVLRAALDRSPAEIVRQVDRPSTQGDGERTQVDQKRGGEQHNSHRGDPAQGAEVEGPGDRTKRGPVPWRGAPVPKPKPKI